MRREEREARESFLKSVPLPLAILADWMGVHACSDSTSQHERDMRDDVCQLVSDMAETLRSAAVPDDWSSAKNQGPFLRARDRAAVIAKRANKCHSVADPGVHVGWVVQAATRFHAECDRICDLFLDDPRPIH